MQNRLADTNIRDRFGIRVRDTEVEAEEPSAGDTEPRPQGSGSPRLVTLGSRPR